MLSAFAVACSSSLKQLQHYGAVAVRLAVLAGALVDAAEESAEKGDTAVSFSLSWASTESNAALEEVLDHFPEVIDLQTASTLVIRDDLTAMIGLYFSLHR